MPLQIKYFVLNPHGIKGHNEASRRALYAYAASIMTEDSQLGVEIFNWVDKEQYIANEKEKLNEELRKKHIEKK